MASGWTATWSTSGRSGSARGPGSARAACSAPAPTSARTPRWPPGRRCSARCPDGEYWSGSPAERIQKRARGPWSDRPATSRAWTAAYGAVAVLLSCLPIAAVLAGAALPVLLADEPDVVRRPARPARLAAGLGGRRDAGPGPPRSSSWSAPAAVAVRPGVHAVRSGAALAVWTTVRVLDDARTWLFPLYASSLTPAWLRLLGARIGKDVEASTVLMIPSLTQVNDQSFLADDTLIGGYELGGGWLRVERVKIGKRAFVGNSGMAAPGPQGPEGLAGRGPVGGAAPQDRPRRGVVAGQPARPAATHRRGQRLGPHLRPADPAQGRPRLRRGRPARARRHRRRAGRGGRDRARRAARPVVRRAARPASSPHRCWPSPGWSRRS